jgi:glyoxylase-like metal-dependent hydrolase (beta-lactamase superfamily II)
LYQDITFGDSWKQKIGKESIRTYYFGAAHTNGDAIIHFEKANIAHMGDLLFNQRPPVIDKTPAPISGTGYRYCKKHRKHLTTIRCSFSAMQAIRKSNRGKAGAGWLLKIT